MEKDIQKIIEQLRIFVAERDWEQFHNPKDLAIALSIEASELLENFLWKHHEDVQKEKVSHELADVFVYCLMLSDKMGIDIFSAVESKMQANAAKYPADVVKGSCKKYTEY